MKKLSDEELKTLADTKESWDSFEQQHFISGYRTAEEKHLKTIAKLQKILKSHRVIIEVMYAPKKK